MRRAPRRASSRVSSCVTVLRATRATLAASWAGTHTRRHGRPGRGHEEIGGELDVIIDDGGHKNSQGHSFCWPLVRNGGVYVIEDLQVGRFKSYGGENKLRGHEGRGVMADKIKDWIEQLVTIPRVFKHTKVRGFKHKIPDDVSFVYCQLEACVIGKRNRHVEGSRPGLPGHDFPGRR